MYICVYLDVFDAENFQKKHSVTWIVTFIWLSKIITMNKPDFIYRQFAYIKLSTYLWKAEETRVNSIFSSSSVTWGKTLSIVYTAAIAIK